MDNDNYNICFKHLLLALLTMQGTKSSWRGLCAMQKSIAIFLIPSKLLNSFWLATHFATFSLVWIENVKWQKQFDHVKLNRKFNKSYITSNGENVVSQCNIYIAFSFPHPKSLIRYVTTNQFQVILLGFHIIQSNSWWRQSIKLACLTNIEYWN